jgi:hypothetical protein
MTVVDNEHNIGSGYGLYSIKNIVINLMAGVGYFDVNDTFCIFLIHEFGLNY